MQALLIGSATARSPLSVSRRPSLQGACNESAFPPSGRTQKTECDTFTFYLYGIQVFQVDYNDKLSIALHGLKCPTVRSYIETHFPNMLLGVHFGYGYLSIWFKEQELWANRIGTPTITQDEIDLVYIVIHRNRTITGERSLDLSTPQSLPVWQKLLWQLGDLVPDW